MALKSRLREDLRLAGFEREAEARETFRGYDGKEHAVAPDACIQIAEADGRVLLGLVELDLGTMSARQLKAKAEGYGEYAKLEGWRQRHDYCPPLLFITTSEKRARSFLSICQRTVDQDRMLVAACGLARGISRSLVEPEWLAGEEESGDLLAVLRGARLPYDEAASGRRHRDARKTPSESGCVLTPPHSVSTCGGGVIAIGASIALALPRPRRWRSRWSETRSWQRPSVGPCWHSARCSPTRCAFN